MQFSSRLSIATHILLVIEVFKNQQKVTSEFIAGSVGVNPVIIRNILGQLKSAGLIEIAAAVGGANLTKSPDQITLLDIFHAVEENPNPNCLVGKNIHGILEGKLDKVKKTAESELNSISLQSLLDSLPTHGR